MNTVLTAEIANIPLTQLHLATRTYNALEKAGITTAGQLAELNESELLKIPNLGKASVATLTQILNSLMASVDDSSKTVDWFEFWRTQNIELIPDVELVVDRGFAFKILPDLIQIILSNEHDDRLWPIIQRRYGILNVDPLTLDELGVVFGLTRERIRQLELKAKRILSQILWDANYTGKSYRVQPQIEYALHEIADIIRDTELGVMSDSDFLASLNSLYDEDPEPIKNTLILALEVSNHERIDLGDPDLGYLWKRTDAEFGPAFESGLRQLDRLLTEDTARAVGEIDLLLALNRDVRKSHRIDLEQLRQLIPLCSTIEAHSKGHYWGKFHRLRGRGNQVERILLEKESPMKIRDISREINHRLIIAGLKPVDMRNLVNQISGDARFVTLGRSGAWALASWSVESGTIIELMTQCLTYLNRAATPEEIYTYVAKRRPVSRNSIHSYLTFDDRFYRKGRTHWGLSSWTRTPAEKSWNPLDVGEFIEGIFKKNRKKQVLFSELSEALCEEANVSRKQAQGMLNVNPVIGTKRRQDRRIIAVFQADWREKLKGGGARFARQKKTLRQKVELDVSEILNSAPGHQMALADIVSHLTDKYKRTDKTFYQYISDLNFVEKYKIPDTGTIMCRLTSSTSATPRLAADQIQSGTIRANVQRALSFMNESDVDIGLFLLSKEFESTLSAYLNTASAKGVHNLPAARMSLNQMIDFVKKAGIISDQAVLHFLRQKRNDRAHGSAPSFEERRLMIRYGEVTASMYIDYIKFFDDLVHQLSP